MTTGEFADKVFAMREAQKEYFRLRTAEALRFSKRLEKEVDSILSQRKKKTYIRQLWRHKARLFAVRQQP